MVGTFSGVGTIAAALALATTLASFPGLPRFFVLWFCVQYNTRKWKSAKNGEGLVSPIM